MPMPEAIVLIPLFGILIYLWNKYVIPFGVKRVVTMNPESQWLNRNQNKTNSRISVVLLDGLNYSNCLSGFCPHSEHNP